jgi:RNA polymerase sigma-70 factor (ECF subfamily)
MPPPAASLSAGRRAGGGAARRETAVGYFGGHGQGGEPLNGEASREEVLELLRARIVSFVASRLSRDRAEDLAQEVLLLLTTKYAHLGRLDDLIPLSVRIARFKLAGYWRKARRRGEDTAIPVEEYDGPDAGPTPEELAVRRQAVERLREAVARLDGRCRELFRLKLDGRSFLEIQSRLGARSINTVYTWDARCRQRLLAMMGGGWAGEAVG